MWSDHELKMMRHVQRGLTHGMGPAKMSAIGDLIYGNSAKQMSGGPKVMDDNEHREYVKDSLVRHTRENMKEVDMSLPEFNKRYTKIVTDELDRATKELTDIRERNLSK